MRNSRRRPFWYLRRTPYRVAAEVSPALCQRWDRDEPRIDALALPCSLIVAKIKELGFTPSLSKGTERVVIGVIGFTYAAHRQEKKIEERITAADLDLRSLQ